LRAAVCNMLLQGFGCGMHWNCGSAAMVDVVPLEELQIVLDVVRVVRQGRVVAVAVRQRTKAVGLHQCHQYVYLQLCGLCC